MPGSVARLGFGSAVVDGKIYVFGGNECTTNSNEVDVYDPSTDSWTTKNPMPFSRGSTTAAAVNGKIYLIGGMTGTTSPLTLAPVQEYDPVTDSWQTKSPMQTNRFGAGSAVIQGKIYVVGGQNSGGFQLQSLEVYDPATDRWRTLAPMRMLRGGPAVAAIGNRLYMFGGALYTGGRSVYLDSVEVYDPDRNTWSAGPSLPQARGGAAAVVANDLIYLTAGFASDTGIVADRTFVFTPDPSRPSITVTPPTHDFRLVTVNSSVDFPITVINTGGGTLEGVATAGAPFAVVSGGSYSLSPGQSQAVTIRFSPTQTETAVNGTIWFTGAAGTTASVTGWGIPPVYATAPQSLDFGNVLIGQTKTLTLTVKNMGTGFVSGNATLSEFFGRTTVNPFRITSGAAYSLGPLESQVITVEFAPTIADVFSAHFAFTGFIGPPVDARGEGVLPPTISVNPASLNFGQVALGDAKDLVFFVSNIGTGTVSGTATVDPPFSIVSGGSYSLGPGYGQFVALRFTPTQTGSFTSAVTFTGGAGAKLPVSGSSILAPVIRFTPAVLEFGRVGVGATSTLTFTLSNLGTATLAGTATVSDQLTIPSPFSIISGGSYSLAPGQSQLITVSFTPTRAAPFAARVMFSGASSDGAPLLGTGITTPAINVTPSRRDFGSLAPRTASDLTFTLTNSGGGTLSGSATVNGPFTVVSGGSYSLSAGQSQPVTIRFAPEQPGAFTANVVFTGDAEATAFVVGSAVDAGAVVPYVVPTSGGSSMLTTGIAADASIGYATLTPDPGQASVAGISIFSYRSANILVSEAGVPATRLMSQGRIYVEVSGGVNTGVAIANPGAQIANVSFVFTDNNGSDFGAQQLTIPPGGQITKFVNESPFNAGNNVHGTLTFSSDVPVGVIAMRGITNERGEFLISSLPVVDTSAPPATGTAIVPHFADAGGWTTQIILVNPTDSRMSGTVQFYNNSGQPATFVVNGQTGSSFPFTLAARASLNLQTAGVGSSVQVGSVRVVTAVGNTGAFVPSALAIFSYRRNNVTVSEAAVPAGTGTALRTYVEGFGTLVQSGIAVANSTPDRITVSFELTDLDGRTLGSSSLQIPGNGQIAKFLGEMFNSLPQNLRGVLRITSTSPVSVVGLRGRYNERNDFLITTTPAIDEMVSFKAGIQAVPLLVNGGGYTTQLILLNGSSSSTVTGTVQMLQQNGSPFDVCTGVCPK